MGKVTGIRQQVEHCLKEAARLRADGAADKAEALLAEQITVLVRDRANYVTLGRGTGAALGAVAGYLMTLLVPGGSFGTLLLSLLGSGYVGERVGKYTGERLSEEEYCEVLRELHRELLDPRGGRPGDAARLRPFWKALLVLETPLEVFGAPPAGTSLLAHAWRSLRRLAGADLFALAVEASRPGGDSFDTLRKFASVLLEGAWRDDDARMTAERLYGFGRDDRVVNHLLASLYFGEMANYRAVREHHRTRFDEPVRALFERDLAAWPDDPTSIRNLAQCYLEEAERGPVAVPVLRAAVARGLEPRGEFALALVEALSADEGALALEQDALLQVVRDGERLVAGGRLGQDALLRLRRLRARWLVDQGREDPEALDLCRRVFAAEPGLRPVALHLARLYLTKGLQDEARPAVVRAAFGLRADLSPPCRAALLEEYGALALTGRERLRHAELLLEAGRAVESVAALEAVRADPASGLPPDERLESARLLAVACWRSGRLRRAYDLFKGLALVEPSDRLMADVFAFGVDLLKRLDRPTLARSTFVLVRSCAPAYVHPELGSLDQYAKEFESVFDYYDEDSIKKVGGGGMAVVFEGREKATGQSHIIKQLRTDLGTPGEIERFRRLFSAEIKAIKRLNESDHPGSRHIIVLYHESSDESSYCYSMERLDAILCDRLAAGPAYSRDEALALVRDIGLGLSCAHAEGVIHRDLNPRNLGFRGPLLKIFDFGTAHLLRTTLHLRRQVDAPAERSAEDVIIGTPSYMSPEQAAGREFDERTDLFALACVAHELLLGTMAFPGRLGSQVLAVQPGVLDELEGRLRERAGEATARALRAALEPDPGARPASVEDLLARLG